jgi:hypothetical protein
MQWSGMTQTQLDLLNVLIPGVSAAFERELDRWIESKARTEYFDVRDDQAHWSLRGYPVTTLTSVEFDPTGKWDGSQVTHDADLWRMVLDDPEEHLLYVESPGAIGRRAMRVTYTGGLGVDTAAVIAAYPDLAMAATLEVANLVQRRSTLSLQAVGTVGADNQMLAALAMLPLTREVMARMKRW